jgi:PTH1 family peptidyl-tRNA hydrolase
VKLVAGLGNPGRKYDGTRHNVGFEVIDRLAARQGLRFEAARVDAVFAQWRHPDDVVLLVKPTSFMNLSGEPVGALGRFYKIAVPDVLIVTDDVNLPLGRLRARATGTEGGHNGLKSIAANFSTIEYARLRVGVGRGDTRRDLADHVLARFDADEVAGIDDAVTRAADAVEVWIADGIARMMNVFNRAVDSDAGASGADSDN